MTKAQELGPIVYKVGRDLTLTEYEDIVRQLTQWFGISRVTKEPEKVARQKLDECCQGITGSGKVWSKMREADLATRIRAKCLYDIVEKKGVGATLEQLKEAKQHAKRKKAVGATKKTDSDEIGGAGTGVPLTSTEEKEWNRIYNGYLRQFPELRSISASGELKIVVDLQILADRFRAKIMGGKPLEIEGLTKITKELSDLKKALGIHADQLSKRTKPKTESTIGAAVLKLEAMGDYRDIRSRFQLEELLQLWQMYNSPSADGLGYQLDDVGFFGQTRCRTCECAGCGKRNAMGFDVEEIQAYLLKTGALEPLPDPVMLEPPVEFGWDSQGVMEESVEETTTSTTSHDSEDPDDTAFTTTVEQVEEFVDKAQKGEQSGL